MSMESKTGAYFDPDFDSYIERIHSPRVCIDNDTCDDCTLVKVDSANRHGILLEMVQLLTDLDLVISKSYITSDGGWLMDVFHVTDQFGNKLTDPTLIHYVEQSFVVGRKDQTEAGEVRTCLGKLVGHGHLASDHATLELTATDRPGQLSEISAVLAEHGCDVVFAQAWTHNSRVACIIYLADGQNPITDPARLANIEEQVGIVVGAHQLPGERWRVAVSGPLAGRVHTERRLHQLMHEDRDYEAGPPPAPVEGVDQFATIEEARKKGSSAECGSSLETRVSIDSWKERDYSVVNIRSRDRPKLLFDTVCTLTDLQYVVFHAGISSQGPLAVQEYYVRHMDGYTLQTEAERRRVTRCLVAAIERRISHGLRVEVGTRNRAGLLSDVTRVFRENGLSLTRAECVTRGERAMGTFYVTDVYGGEVDPNRMEAVRAEIGGRVSLVVVNSINNSNTPEGWPPVKKMNAATSPSRGGGKRAGDDRPRFSLGSLLWSHIERFSSNFGSIRS